MGRSDLPKWDASLERVIQTLLKVGLVNPGKPGHKN
jgi:hypothetical protein